MIKFVLSDMDNTLIPFGNELVSQRTIDAIHACQEQGIDVGPASGRDRGELSSFFGGDASCYNTGVLVNGQRIYYLGEIVYEKTLPRDELRAVERLVAPLEGCAFITYRDNNFGDWVGEPRERLGAMYDRSFMCGGRRHEMLPDYPVVKAGIVCLDPGRLTQLQRQLGEMCPDLIFPNTVVNWMDVSLRDWNKGDGVKILQRVLGLADEEVCVFGDADNDLGMLNAVPNSCAVANANENAARAARWHVGASADDGVAIALEQIAEAGRIYNETGEDVLPAFMRSAD
ncbi:MAG: HAD family hydrolase [Olegusella sp.]|nr:HAD family hydrolase [Olegusella sp.]